MEGTPAVDFGPDAGHALLKPLEQPLLIREPSLERGEFGAVDAERGVVVIPGPDGDQEQAEHPDRHRHQPAGGREPYQPAAIGTLHHDVHSLGRLLRSLLCAQMVLASR